MSALALTFRIYRKDQLLREETLRQGVIKLGKVPSAHLRLDDDSVSRMHAIIEVDTAGRVHLIDLGSTRGTFVNGQKIDKARLETGDELTIGDLRIEVAFAKAVPELKAVPPAIPVVAKSRPLFTQVFDDEPAGAKAIEVAAMLGDSVVGVKHCMNPKSGQLSKQTLGMFGIGAASLLAAAVSFGVSVHTSAENKAGLQRTIAEHRPAYSFRPEVLSPAWDLTAFGGFALGMSTVIAGLARARSEKRSPSYRIGTGPDVDAAVAVDRASFPLVAPSANGDDFVFNYGAGIDGELLLDGTATSLADLIATGKAKPSPVVAGALELPIPPRAKIRAKAGQTTFMVSAVAEPRHQAAPLFDHLEARTLKYFAGALAFHLGVILIANTIPSDDTSAAIDIADEMRLENKTSQTVKDDLPPDQQPEDHGEGTGETGVAAKAMKLDEGQAGDHDSNDTNKHLAVKDMKTTPQITREEAIHDAQIAGILGSLSSPEHNFNALVDETGLSSGFDDATFYGNLYGADAGTAHGEFGGGLIGFGRGGGCPAGGDCGLIGNGGRYNTIGSGRHAGGGWGGLGGDGLKMKKHEARIPVDWHGTASIVGGLDRAIIKRYIKMNIEKISYCYEHELIARPNLEGSVNIVFFISPNGVVTSASGKGFDTTVDDCVAGVISRIEFPKPQDGGGVNVTYPFTFHATK